MLKVLAAAAKFVVEFDIKAIGDFLSPPPPFPITINPLTHDNHYCSDLLKTYQYCQCQCTNGQESLSVKSQLWSPLWTNEHHRSASLWAKSPLFVSAFSCCWQFIEQSAMRDCVASQQGLGDDVWG